MSDQWSPGSWRRMLSYPRSLPSRRPRGYHARCRARGYALAATHTSFRSNGSWGRPCEPITSHRGHRNRARVLREQSPPREKERERERERPLNLLCIKFTSRSYKFEQTPLNDRSIASPDAAGENKRSRRLGCPANYLPPISKSCSMTETSESDDCTSSRRSRLDENSLANKTS